MHDDIFTSGQLLLGEGPDTVPDAALAAEASLLEQGLVIASVLGLLLLLRNFLHILPYLADSVLRARGSSALENSVRVSRDRNLVAAGLLVPFGLVLYHYDVFQPGFIGRLAPPWPLPAFLGLLAAWLLFRLALYRLLRPRRRQETYALARRAGFTFFILLVLLVFITVGILFLMHTNELTIKTFIVVECAVVYGAYLLRRAQILLGMCNGLTTFLYLCGLEFLPTGLLIALTVVL